MRPSMSAACAAAERRAGAGARRLADLHVNDALALCFELAPPPPSRPSR